MTGTAYGYPIPETTDITPHWVAGGRMYHLDPPLALMTSNENFTNYTQEVETRFVVAVWRAPGSRGFAAVDEEGKLFIRTPWVTTDDGLTIDDGLIVDRAALHRLGYEIVNEEDD